MTNDKITNKYFIHSAITFILSFGFGYLPAPEPITHMGMQIIGVFLGMLYGWCTVDLLWPSILGLVALGCTEYTNVPGAIAAMCENSTVQQLAVCMLLFAYCEKEGLTNSMAKWVITRKFISGRPWVLVIALFGAMMFLAAFVQMLVSVLILWMFFEAAVEEMGYEKGDAYPSYVLMGIPVCGGFMASVLPFKGGGLMLTGMISAGSGITIPMMQYIAIVGSMGMLIVITYLLIGKFIVKPDTSKFINASSYFENYAKDNTSIFKKEQRPQAIALIVFVIMIFAISIVPKSSALYPILNKFGIQGLAMLILCVMSVVPSVDGKPDFNFAEVVKKGVNWNLLWLMAATFVIAAAIQSQESGIIDAIASVLTPLLQSVGYMQFLVVLAVVLIICSQFAHNLILQMVFIPLTCPIMMAAGYNPLVSSFVIFFATNFAYLTPGGCAQSAMIFGNSWIAKKDIYKVLGLVTVIGGILTVTWLPFIINLVM